MKLEIQFTSSAAADAYTGGKLYGSDFAAGLDLRAAISEPMSILPSEQAMIPTGIKINMMELGSNTIVRHAAMAMPRSGRGSKEGLVLGNTIGLIDQDYHGEIMLCAWARPTSGHINGANNRVGGTPIHIEPWERIAQLVIVPVIRPEIVAVHEFSVVTDRGAGGFGSTGV
jgi:dUTP pyrophosphatase